MAPPHAPAYSSFVADSVYLLLLQEIVRYSSQRCENEKDATVALLQDIGYPVGYRIVERLTLTKWRFWEQSETLKFVCKDLWNFLFQKQADRLQTDLKGGYAVFEGDLPWLRNFQTAGLHGETNRNLDSSEDGTKQLTPFSAPDKEANPLWSDPAAHVAIICGIIQGCVSNLGLKCNVKADTSDVPACSFQIIISSSIFFMNYCGYLLLSASSTTSMEDGMSDDGKLSSCNPVAPPPPTRDKLQSDCVDRSSVASAESLRVNKVAQAMSVEQTKDYEFSSILEEDIYETLRTIRDPEFPEFTLGNLGVITPPSVTVINNAFRDTPSIHVAFKPTAAHCSMASLIGLSIRRKLELEFDHLKYKIDLALVENSHDDIHNLMKQINDKERIRAAYENPNVLQIVENSISEEDT